MARPPTVHPARPWVLGRDRAEGERAVRLAAAVPSVPRSVPRPASPAPAAPPRPARAARARRLALLLQPRRRSPPRFRSPIRCWAMSSLRMLVAGFWPRERAGHWCRWCRSAGSRWLPRCSPRGRIALNVADSHVIDIGVAGVVGADHITHGQRLYTGGFAPGCDPRRRVRPVQLPRLRAVRAGFPWNGLWGDVPAAHAAAIAFDLLQRRPRRARSAPARWRRGAGRSGSRSLSHGSPARGRSTR